jgi:hypothetical protein
MSLIDLTTQAQAPQTGGLSLQSSATTSSLTGLYTLEFDNINVDNLGTGSLNIGATNTLTTGKLKLAHTTDPVIMDAADNTAIQLLTTGYPSGSIKIFGDLIVQGSASYNNVSTFAVEDPIIDLNFTGSTALSSTDSGIRVGRVGSTNAALVFDHSETRWAIDNAAGSYINIVGASTTDTLTNKTITSLATSTMASAGNLTFSGDGEVLGLPAAPTAQGSAVSKAYLNAQLTGSVTSSGLNYLRKNYVKVATGVTGSATASFAATTASAPSGMTATSENDFIFFMNGGYMEHNAVEIEQSGSIFLLKINTSDLGYNLESDDEIIAQGKFNS